MYGNEGLSLAWDLGIIFLGMQDLQFGGFKKNLLDRSIYNYSGDCFWN